MIRLKIEITADYRGVYTLDMENVDGDIIPSLIMDISRSIGNRAGYINSPELEEESDHDVST